MPRKTFAAVLLVLAVLALVMPGKAVAGPPEGVSGKMVLAGDEVADGLRKYRKEANLDKKVALLLDLRKTKDLRVAVALGETLDDTRLCHVSVPTSEGWAEDIRIVNELTAAMLLECFLPPGTNRKLSVVRAW